MANQEAMEEPGILSDPTSGAMYAICIATIPVCAVVTALRFLATYRSGRSIGWEDWFALLAFVTHFIHCVLGILIIDVLRGREVVVLPPHDILHVGKLIYSLVPMFPLNQLFAKFSILFLYYRLFSIRKSFKYWMWGCGVVQIGYSIATFLVSLLSCQPVSKGWNLVEPGYCINHSIFLAASETVNSSVDFVMVILAIVMIQDLKMKKSTKWKLGILFGFGGFSGVVGFVKVGESYGDPGTSSNINSALWTTVQQAFSVVCCCAPIYRSLSSKRARIGSLSRPHGTKTGPSQFGSDSDASSTELDARRGTLVPIDPLASNKREEAWLHLDGSSQRGLSWTDVEASPNTHGGEPQYPSRTVQVQQNVELV